MIKRLFAVMLFAGLISSGVAQDKKSRNLINCENPAEWTGKVLLNKKVKRSGEFSFETFGKYPTVTTVKEFIPIDSDSTYTLTCYMRSLDPKQPASGYMGLYMYDKNKRLITLSNINVGQKSESELVSPAIKGATEIVIKNSGKCLKYKGFRIAFNVKNNYADLPNFDLSSSVKKISLDGDKLKLTLASPLQKAYKVGTKIRFHSPYAAPFFWAAQGWMPGEWKKFSLTLKGVTNCGGTPGHKFWKSTKYVKPFIWFANYNRIPKAGARLLVDDFSFVKSVPNK